MLIFGIGIRLRGNRHPSEEKENKTRKLLRIGAGGTDGHADLGKSQYSGYGLEGGQNALPAQ